MKNLFVDQTLAVKKNLFVKLLLLPLVLFSIGVGNVWGDAAVGDVLWAEDFSGYSANDVPSGSITNSHTGTTVYDGSVTYTCTNGQKSGKTNGGTTSIYNAQLAGGTSPELLVGKKGGASVAGGTFSISGIPSGGATKLTVSYKQNGNGLSASVSGTGYSGSNSASTAGTQSFDVTVGSASTFTLTFTATSTSNVRLDDISVVVKTAGAAGSTKTLSSAVSPAGSGSVELGKTSLAPGATTTATATANDGYAFSSWGISGTGASLSSTSTNPTTITMGSADATVTANFSCVTPTFGTNLSTSTVNYTTGASASALTVAASANNATIYYQWQTSTDNSNWSNTGANASGNTSITPSTAAAGTTYYRCIATNTASGCSTTATSNVATITVSAPTPATITLKNYSGDATTTGYYSGGSFTLPSTNDFTCGDLTFVGWSSEAIISPSATKPASNYYEPGESVTLGASNTFYAVFAESGGGGSETATISQSTLYSGISGTQAYGDAASSLDDDQDYSWTVKANSQVTGSYRYIQMRIYNNSNGVSYIQLPDYPGNISSISLTVSSTSGNTPSAGSNSTTLYLCADAEANVDDPIASGSGASAITLTPTSNVSTGYIKAGGGIRIWAISTTYSSTSYSNYTTNCVNMRTIYLDAYHFGDSDGAKFAIYSWKDGSDDNKLSETFMTKVTDCYYEHLYEGEMPDNHDRVIFLRNASAAASPVKDGANKLNQTVDITTDGDKDFFTIASGGEGNTYNGSWSVYTPHYTVTFDKNGAGTTDSWPSDQCIANGGKASEPSSPQTMGKTFVGWYQEAEGTNAWVFNTNTVTAATTIYAKWNDVATKTIYLDASATLGGGKQWDADNTVLFAHAYINGTSLYTDVKATSAISSCQPHVYAFTIPGNADYVSFARCETGTTELPASWDNDPVYNKIVGMAIENGKDHYRVTDWSSATLESSAFAPESYTISYSAGTGGSGTRDAENKACDVAFTLPNAQVFTRDGYTMDGWATEDGGAKEYNLGGSYTTNAAQTFYPHWAAANYGVTLNVNGGTINAGNVTSYTFGTGATLPTDVTKAHATFQGWYAASNFSGERIYSISTSEYGDKAYWAKWEAITYTVTWKANGSIVRTDNNVAEGGKVASVPSAPADLTTDPNGCDAEFVGWVLEANDPGALSISSQSSTPSGLFTNVAGSPAITANTTFIAIYRQEQ